MENIYLKKHNQKLEIKGIQYRAELPYSSKTERYQNYVCLKNGHSFEADRARMVLGKLGCPHCVGDKGHRSPIRYLAEVENLNKGWKVLEPYKGTSIKIKHECPKGHIREMWPKSVLSGSNCVVCSGNAKKTTEEYEKELFDKGLGFTVCEEYKNSMTKIKHQCLECDNVWEVKPHDILHGSGCPKCAKTGFNPYKPAKIYYVELTNKENTTFWKIGITAKKNILHRFRAEKLQVKLLWEKQYDLGEDALKNEQLILSTYFADLAPPCDFLKHGGNTELFTRNVLEK